MLGVRYHFRDLGLVRGEEIGDEVFWACYDVGAPRAMARYRTEVGGARAGLPGVHAVDAPGTPQSR